MVIERAMLRYILYKRFTLLWVSARILLPAPLSFLDLPVFYGGEQNVLLLPLGNNAYRTKPCQIVFITSGLGSGQDRIEK